MKKFLSMLFALAMILGCMGGMGVSADGGFSLSVSEASGFAGQEVQVTVSVNDNIGISGIIYTLSYDANVLELVGVEDAALLGGFTASPTLQTNPYKCLYAQAANTSANGVLATYTFAIKAGATAGDTVLDLELVQCLQGETNVTPAMVDGKVTVKEDASSIVASSVVLTEDIAMNFYAELSPSDVGAQMKFTFNGEQVLVDGIKVEGNEYCYTFTGIAPQTMGDSLKAELVKGDKVIDTKDGCSVRKYCDALTAQSASELGISQEAYEALETLVADLLEYGASAQEYKLYKTDALVNEGITGASEFVSFANNDKAVEKTEYYNANMAAGAAGVYFDHENSLFLKYNCYGFTAENARIAMVEIDPASGEALGDATIFTINDSENLGVGKYVLKVPVAPQDYDTVYMFSMQTLIDGNWVMSQNVNYSVNAYIYSIVNGGKASAAMVDLAKTLYNYGVSASAFNALMA